MRQEAIQTVLSLLIMTTTASVNQAKASEEKTAQRIQSAQHTQQTGQNDNLEKAYDADLQRRIKRAWFPPEGKEDKRVVIIFKVHQGGDMTNLRVGTSSGVAIADNAALKAVENAAPFRPLPPGSPESMDFRFIFDSDLFTSGDGAGSLKRF